MSSARYLAAHLRKGGRSLSKSRMAGDNEDLMCGRRIVAVDLTSETSQTSPQRSLCSKLFHQAAADRQHGLRCQLTASSARPARIEGVIPGQASRDVTYSLNRAAYRFRTIIERMFGRLKY